MKIGSHVSNSGEKMLQGAVETALSFKENCFMFYIGAPQNTKRKDPELLHIKEFQDILKENNISLDDAIVHAPYVVNLASPDDEKWKFAVDFLTKEVKLVGLIGSKYMVLHPGSSVGESIDYAISRISNGLRIILENTKDLDVVILLETMAGKGTEVGRCFKEIKRIMDEVKSNRIKVCLDTCHIHDAGYDIVNHYEDVLNEFDQIIGLSNIKTIHLNDSKNELASHKDRHENIGFGKIGFDTLYKVLIDERFQDIPKILETPYVKDSNENSYEPYKYEIEMLREGRFNPNLKEIIINK